MKTFTNLWKSKKLFLAAALLCGGMTAKAQTAVSEGFEDWGTSEIADGWLLINDATYGNTYSYDYVVGSDDFTPNSGSNCLANSGHSNAAGTTSSPMIVTPKMTGTFSFKFRKYNTSSSTKGYIDIFEYDESTGAATGSAVWRAYPNGTNEATSKYQDGSITVGNTAKRYAIYLAKVSIDDLTYTKEDEVSEGPALVVKDGSKITSPYSYNFGLTTAGSTHVFTLSNPGTEAVEGLSVTETGNFNATLSATSIAVGEDVTLTVTMPEATGNSEITISSTTEGIGDFIINVSGTIKNPNKVYLDFADGQMPDGWTSVKVGSWAADWTVAAGYVYQSSNQSYSTANYDAAFTSPKLTFTENETILFESAKYSNNTNACYIKVQYSSDRITWTDASENFTDDTYGTWTQRSATIPTADANYIRFYGKNVYLRNIYGGELPIEPKMVVTEPTDLTFGSITETATKTFTIANTGLAALNSISVTSSNDLFTITGAPTALAAGESAEVTITMAATTIGNQTATITVSATDQTDVTFIVTGTVMPTGLSVIDFNDNTLPSRWENTGWTFSDGAAYAGYSSSPYTMTTPKIQVNDGDLFVVKAKLRYSGSYYYVAINGSSDNGETWKAYTKTLSSELNTTDYTSILIDDVPSTVNKLQFVSYYGYIDEIQGINYAAELDVTQDGTAVESPAAYNFGECAANTSVTYTFANAGAGTINITNVAITGEGDAAYTTNWTESTAVPFDLVITRSYDAERTAAAEAVVTVTTTEGDFVINVTGTDKAANAPELAVTLAGETVTTGAAVDFGKQLQAAPEAKTFTVTNSGTGTLTGTIATSDDSKFTVSKTSFSLGAAESMTFDVALVYDTNYGAKAATITITPADAGLEAVLINATASTLDPEAWTEDFAAGTLPSGWTQGTWTIGTFKDYENTTTMALAPSSSTAGTIITPRLSAKAGDVLTWDAYFNWYDEAMTVEYSDDDQAHWTKIYDAYEAQEDFGSTRYTHKEMSFTAPADGSYYLRFTSTYQNGIDNLCGFKLDLPEHIMAITASNIPTSGSYSPSMKATKPFDATVTVTESRGVDEENVIAKLYMGEDVIGTSETVTVEANSTKVITITATPTAAATEGAEMHIEVTYDGGTLNTEAVTRYVAEFKKLELTEAEAKDIETGYSAVYDQVTLTRSFAQGWNTFVAPIATAVTEFGEGAKFYEFKSFEDGALNFSLVTSASLTGATPYIVYVPEAISEKVFTWDEPVIYSSYVGADNIKATKDGVTFQGTYAPVAAGGLTGNYGVTPAGKIQKAGSSASIKGFRAYFTGITSEARLAFTDESTGITTVITAGELTDGKAFDLQGRNVQNLKKGGLYIINGKKQVVK